MLIPFAEYTAISKTLPLLVLSLFLPWISCETRSFSIDYENDRFLKDGQPYKYISGSLHYFRVPAIYWRDRLLKIKAAGLNVVETYVAWNFHQPESADKIELAGNANLTGFLDIAKSLELDVILRPGPYICAEWEHGGLPWWILKDPGIKIRTSDPIFMDHVKRWFSRLLPLIIPYLYGNGGPILMVQVENEYGSFYACDRKYMAALRSIFQFYLGKETVLFTTDGADVSYLRCGAVDGVYATVDFGPNGDQAGIDRAFAAQRTYSPQGPLVNSEFYTTWLDVFGGSHAVGDPDVVSKSLSMIYKMNASINFYMISGGTNFGYMGSGFHPNITSLPFFTSTTTSYDYGAPIGEAGELSPTLYQKIRETIERETGKPVPVPVPAPISKRSYGSVRMDFAGTLLDLLPIISPNAHRAPIKSVHPRNFVDLDFPYGFVLYEHTLVVNDSTGNLTVPGIADRGYVMIDGVFQGILSRNNQTWLKITANVGQKLSILVENMGRQNYWRGSSGVENDFKGITSNVSFDANVLLQWSMYPISLEKMFATSLSTIGQARNSSGTFSLSMAYIPSIYYGVFPSFDLADTFFDPTGWGKGQMFINGANVGRYWPSLGPQVTLYLPKDLLSPTLPNVVVLLELENPGNCQNQNWQSMCQINFGEEPVLHKHTQVSLDRSLWAKL